MPGLILTGYPSAGKSTVAQLLKDRALKRPDIQDVVIINEETARPGLSKQACYESSLAEKQTRAALKSSFDKAIAASNKKTLVVLDSLNYIKGFRYELHCLSKAAGERHGILWVLNQVSVAEEWNSRRESNNKESMYSTELLKELIQRYEPPDERNRWDKPLFTIDPLSPAGGKGSASMSDAVKKSVYNMHDLADSLSTSTPQDTAETTATVPSKKVTKSAFTRTKRKPTEQKSAATTAASTAVAAQDPSTSQAASITSSQQEGQAKSEHVSVEDQLDEILATFLSGKELREGTSTKQHVAGDANALAALDATTARLVSTIVSAQTLHIGGLLQVPVGSSSLAMNCKRNVALPELRRLRKQYLQWAGIHPPDDTTEVGIAASFLRYVEEQLK
eukprot:Nitzschia sp. Nitz4//scaffold48_size128905//23106//24281//NITZ4_003582-RA/size128905-processed-gene-0.106-mRNA-1//-1//CDS//3329552928//5500//frame0